MVASSETETLDGGVERSSDITQSVPESRVDARRPEVLDDEMNCAAATHIVAEVLDDAEDGEMSCADNEV